jgi:hypothetical protein
MRPTLPLSLLRVAEQPAAPRLPSTRAIVDSGADRTTLPANWAPLLGIDLLHDCIEEEPITAGGPTTHYAFGGGLWVELLGEEVLIPVVNFSHTLVFSLLGRQDFFDRYLVMIDQPGKRFFLERHPDREEDDPDDDDQLDVALAG